MTDDDLYMFPFPLHVILGHIPIPLSPFFTIMGAISTGSVQQSEAQLQPKRPWVETTDPTTSSIPSSSTSSSSTIGGVTLEAIMK